MWKDKLANKIGQILGIYNKTNKGEITMTNTKNIRKVLLESGVEIKGEYERVKVWLPEVEEFTGVKDFTLSDKVNVTIDLSTFHEGKVLDIGALFFDTDIKVAVGVSKTEVYTDKGNVISIRDLFDMPYKKGGEVIKGDYVELQNCFTGETIVTLGGIILKSSLPKRIGVVKSISERDGVVSIGFGDKTIRLPKCCLNVVNGLLMSDKFKTINTFLNDSGTNASFDGTMWGVSVDESGDYLEYITEARLGRFEGYLYNEELRKKYATKKKIRGAIQSIYPSISAQLMEDVIMLYCSKGADVDILTGEKMREVFIADKCSGSGSIASSCMRNKNPNYFDIYVENCDGIAIIRDGNGKIVLRAILWTIHKADGTTMKFMDRIYSGNTAFETKMKAWAIQNNYAYLDSQSHSMTRMTMPDSKKVSLKHWFVKCKKPDYERYPYLDTFSTMVGGFLFYRNQPALELKSTSGGSSCMCGDR